LLLYPDNIQPRLLTVSGGEEVRDVDFTLPPSALFSVSGNVQALDQNTRFWVALASMDQAAIVLAATQAEADGSFRLDGMAPGSYYVFASGPIVARSAFGAIVGSEPLFGRTRVDIGHQNVNGISIAVDKGRAVTIIVRAESGQQPESACPSTATLTLSSVEDWGAVLDRTVQAGLGRETLIGGLAPARYELRAQLGEACFQAADVVLDLTSRVGREPVEVLVAPGGSVRGRLTGAGEPTGFAFELAACGPEETAGQLRIVFPDAESRFAFDGLRPGRYRIAARPVSEAHSLRRIAHSGRTFEIEVRAGATTELELPAAAGPNEAPPGQDRR
jgi:hypothetical protein